MDRTDVHRPLGVTVAGSILVVVALVAAVMGMLASWASECCGSTESSDPAPALVGMLVAGALGAAAVGLVAAAMRPWHLLVLTAVAPGTCVAAAPHSSDLGALALFALLAWGGFALFLRRPSIAAWLAERG